MSKLLFHLPRPTVPIFTRNSSAGKITVATTKSDVPLETMISHDNDKQCPTSASPSPRQEQQPRVNRQWVKSPLEFPIRRIYCVGRNYREHALEMGGDPDREPPFFFQKPADAVVVSSNFSAVPSGEYDAATNMAAASVPSSTVPYPPMTSSLHHEGELIIAISKDGLRIPVSDAMDHVYGYALGCDLTRRDLQSEAKKRGRPWDAAKGFDGSCPMGPIVPKEDWRLVTSEVDSANVGASGVDGLDGGMQIV